MTILPSVESSSGDTLECRNFSVADAISTSGISSSARVSRVDWLDWTVSPSFAPELGEADGPDPLGWLQLIGLLGAVGDLIDLSPLALSGMSSKTIL